MTVVEWQNDGEAFPAFYADIEGFRFNISTASYSTGMWYWYTEISAGFPSIEEAKTAAEKFAPKLRVFLDEKGKGMTNEPVEATPRSVRDALQKTYREVTDFDTELFNALFAALTMLEKQKARLAALESRESNLHVRLAALEAVQNPAPPALFDGEAAVLRDGLLLTPEAVLALRGRKRARIVIYAEDEDADPAAVPDKPKTSPADTVTISKATLEEYQYAAGVMYTAAENFFYNNGYGKHVLDDVQNKYNDALIRLRKEMQS